MDHQPQTHSASVSRGGPAIAEENAQAEGFGKATGGSRRGDRDAGLAAHILGLVQNEGDLLLAEPRLLHQQNPSVAKWSNLLGFSHSERSSFPGSCEDAPLMQGFSELLARSGALMCPACLTRCA
jgi:hypothetical protein